MGGSGADGTGGRAYDSRVFCDLRGSKTTFLPGMGGRGGELRDAGWAESLGVDNLILVTKLGEEIYGNKKESVMHDGEGGSFIGWEMGE